jgi:hypothetical protein
MGIKGYKKKLEDKNQREALEEYRRVRVDDDEMWNRKQTILQQGLTAMIHLEMIPDELWSIVLEPTKTFTHLMNDVGLDESYKRGDVYHVSICFDSDIRERWQQQALAHLHKLYDKPVEHTFRIARINKGLSANLSHDDEVFKEIRDLHRYGSYHYKDIHISL